MYRPALPMILALLPTALWAQEKTPPGVSFYHHDWELACDNTRTCRAAGYQSDNDELLVSVLLTRKAGPQQALLAVLPGTSDIRWHYQNLAWHLSDSGAAAVLRRMDDVQGRVGTASAILRKGSRSESEVLPTLPIPTVTAAALRPLSPDDQQRFAAHQEAIRKALQETVAADDCSGLILTEDGSETLELTRLTASKLLVSATGWTGAYNIGYGYWVINEAPPYQPRLVTDSGSGFKTAPYSCAIRDAASATSGTRTAGSGTVSSSHTSEPCPRGGARALRVGLGICRSC